MYLKTSTFSIESVKKLLILVQVSSIYQIGNSFLRHGIDITVKDSYINDYYSSVW